jgi:16S rRNA (adenine1518-N6/adenine1519-N6)-dimethyltransferase
LEQVPIQTKSAIEAILASAGVRPRKRFGQNFLIDGNLVRRFIATAEVDRDDVVLEVGPGTGLLTEQLAPLAGRVVAVEIDTNLAAIVSQRLAGAENVSVICTDVLAGKHEIAPQVLEAIERAREAATGRCMLVANLPYAIATPLMMNLCVGSIAFSRFCVTVQREVADRLTASPGTRDFGPVSVAVQATGSVERFASLPPQVFWPRPEVDSAMVRIDFDRNPFETRERLASFVRFCRSGFAHRRKTLRSNLGRVLETTVVETLAGEFDLGRRAEQFSVEEWVALGKRVVS